MISYRVVLLQARRYLSNPKVKAFNKVISVDWADPQEDPPEEVMAKVGACVLERAVTGGGGGELPNTWIVCFR